MALPRLAKTGVLLQVWSLPQGLAVDAASEQNTKQSVTVEAQQLSCSKCDVSETQSPSLTGPCSGTLSVLTLVRNEAQPIYIKH